MTEKSPSPEMLAKAVVASFGSKVSTVITTAVVICGGVYGVIQHLRITPLEQEVANLRADKSQLQSRLDKADADYKTLSLSTADARVKVAGLEVNADSKSESLTQCQASLAQAQRGTEIAQRIYSMANHLDALRKRQADLEAQIKGHHGFIQTAPATGAVKESLERDIGNLQKQIEAATKCS